MSLEQDFEDVKVELENAANFMRGMAMFDKRLPSDIAKLVLTNVSHIDEFMNKINEG